MPKCSVGTLNSPRWRLAAPRVARPNDTCERIAGETPKLALTYSASRIPVYWIVNLVERQIEAYTSSTPGGYETKRDYKADEKVPIVLDGIVVRYVAVSDILP
jgi:hypothetical protein